MLAAELSILESEFEDALNLKTMIEVGVIGRVAIVTTALLTEIHAASKLTDAEELSTLDKFALERALINEALVSLHGAEVSEETEFLTHGEEAVLRAHLSGWVVIIARIAYGAKEYGVALEASLESVLREWVASGIDGASAYKTLGESGLMAELLADGIDCLDCLLNDLGTDSVAREKRDIEFHLYMIICFYIRTK